jgi:putative MATE family efflux protein
MRRQAALVRDDTSGWGLAGIVLSLAGPVLIEQFLLYLVGLSDTVLAGRFLSVTDLAAVTVANYLLFFCASILVVVSAGATALVSRFVGAGSWRRASHMMHQVVLLGWAVGLVILALGWPFAPQLVSSLNLVPAASGAAVTYLRIILAIVPLQSSLLACSACLRGAGDTRTGMWVMAGVNLLNITCSWALVTGWLGLPRLGVAGIAIGTACAEALGSLVMLGILMHGRAGLKLRLDRLRPRVKHLVRLLNVSIPAAGESITNAFCQLWFLSLINRLGARATAAHGVAIRCESIAYLTVMAFGVAAATLVGQSLGARNPGLARRSARVSWLLGVLVISLLGLLLWFQADAFVALFLNPESQAEKQAIGRDAVQVIRIVVIALPAIATIIVLAGALRGAGATRWPWMIVILGYLLVRMPLTYLLARPVEEQGWGLVGAWVAMFADLHARGLLLFWRFWEGSWQNRQV